MLKLPLPDKLNMRMQDIRRLIIPQTEFQNMKINDANMLKEI